MPRLLSPTRLLSVVLLLGLAGVAFHSGLAQDERKQADIAGRYTCVGTTFDGTKYRGSVRLVKQGDTYVATWTLDAGDSYAGVGLLTDNVLSVAWDAGDAPGIIAYKVEKKNGMVRLVGKWTVPGVQGKLMDETLTPML